MPAERNTQALLSPYTCPGPGQPGPGSQRGRRGCQGSGTSPDTSPAPGALGQLHWLPVKASKGCAKQAGAPGWNGLLKPRWEDKGRPLWAGPAGARGGKREPGEGGWVGTARCRQLPAASGRSQVWPPHSEELQARGRPCFGRWRGPAQGNPVCLSRILKSPLGIHAFRRIHSLTSSLV